MTASLSGAERRAIAARIVAAYDDVAAGGGALWISIEAPSGWGKTRIVQDVYARLAARQDETGRYWPQELVANAGSDVLRDRKTVAPAMVEREPGSLPSFFWWGISAFERSGVPSVALAQDLRQFDGHLPFLVARCKQLTRLREKGSANARELAKIALEEAGGELTSAVLDLAGLGIPGVGFVWRLGSWTAGRISGARHERRIVAAGSTIREDHSQIVEDAYETIQSVSRPGLPIIAVIEDLQYADATLIDLLVRLTTSGKPILVLSTAWPGVFEGSDALTRLQAPGAPLVRLSTVRAVPAGWPSMRPLDREDLAAIVREHYPRATDRTIDALAERSDNPLQLRLACALPSIARRASDGYLDLDPAVVAALPSSLDAMYEQMWTQLPEPVRESLAFALCGIPTDVDYATSSGDDRWDAALLMRVARSLFPDAAGLVEAIDAAQTGYAWAELVGDALRVFPDEANRRIVEERRPEFYSMLDIERIRRELTKVIGEELEDPTLSESVRQHRAALLLALSAEGFGVDAAALSAAAEVQTEQLAALDESDRVIEVIDRVAQTIADAESPPAALPPEATPADLPKAVRPTLGARIAPMAPALRLRRAVALMRSERWDEAERELEDIIAHAGLLGGPDDPLALDARIERAALELQRPRQSAGVDLDLHDLGAAVDRVFGETDDRALRLLRMYREQPAQAEIARLPDMATEWGRFHLADLAKRFSPTHPDFIAYQRIIATEGRNEGYPGLAAAYLDDVAARLSAAVGSTHPEVLRLRLEQARALIADGRSPEAIDIAAPIRGILERAAGSIDADTCTALVVLAAAEESQPGLIPDIERDIEHAVDQYPSALPRGPVMRLRIAQARMALAHEGEAGSETIHRLLDITGDAGDVLGELDEDVTALRILIAEVLLSEGHVEAAFVAAEAAVWVCAHWSMYPQTWRAVLVLGRCHELLGRPAEAVTAFEFVADAAGNVRHVAEEGGQPSAFAAEVLERAEAAIRRVQRASPTGWYPTDYVEVRPRPPGNPYGGGLPWLDSSFIADDEQLLRLRQHQHGRALLFGPAESTARMLQWTVVRYLANRGEHEEALAAARALLSIEQLPVYARSGASDDIDWNERMLVLWLATESASELGRPRDAIELLDATIRLADDRAVGGTGRDRRAEMLDDKARMLDDKARLLEDIGAVDEALAALDELASAVDAAARVGVRMRAIELLVESDRSEQALSSLDDLLVSQDGTATDEIIDRAIDILETADRWEDVVGVARAAMSASPSHARRVKLRSAIASALSELQRFEEAADVVGESLAEPLSPEERSPLLRHRAHLLARAGDFARAADDLEDALSIDPDDRFAVVALVEPLVRLERRDEATERFMAAVAAGRSAGVEMDDFHFRYSVLRMVIDHGQPDGAVTLAEEFLLLLDTADLGSMTRIYRELGEGALAMARKKLG